MQPSTSGCKKQVVDTYFGRKLATAQWTTKRKKKVVPWIHPSNDEDVVIWKSRYNPDPDMYRCRAALTDMTLEKSRSLRDEVTFYPRQFEVGLRLPVDHFISKLIEQTNAILVKLLMNPTRIYSLSLHFVGL